jgi:4'-phosphopantetheinyl transferase
VTSRADVDVWSVDLDAGAAFLPRYLAELSPDERAHAGRLRTSDALAGFSITRAVLRLLLGRRVGVPAHALRFGSGPYGKPFLAQHPELAFNVSHTRGRAVLAVAARGPVGVDVERLEPRVDVDGLAQRFFSPAEVTALREVPAGRRLRAFFDGWTRKEAFVKALGEGLSHDLASFTVALTPGEPVELLSRHRDDWRIVRLDVGADYAAALVLPRNGPLLLQRRSWRHSGAD